MNTALADPLVPRTLAAARARRVAIVMADASCGDLVGSLLAGAAGQWAVAARGVDDVADDRPDAVVLVADAAVRAGMAALRRIRGAVPGARIVVVARNDNTANAARQALNAGAEAFVPTEEVEHALAPALDAVMAGLICAPRGARRLVAKPTFSHREKEVLELLVEGLTNRQIAGRLFVAESTVKSHLVSTFAKLGVRSRKDAVALLLDPAEGLVTTALLSGARPLASAASTVRATRK
jgi:DNA-binding NarL/FixJ family response regulator